MTFDEIIAVASEAYKPHSDTLERFIAVELMETFDSEATSAEQLEEAARVLKAAHDNLFRVWNALVAERCREAEGE